MVAGLESSYVLISPKTDLSLFPANKALHCKESYNKIYVTNNRMLM